jgi:uncharacterized membrane protein
MTAIGGWLTAGWQDMRAAPLASMFYGSCFAAMGFGLYLVFARATQYITTLGMGFLLLGPVLAIGLYALSRARADGKPVRLIASLTAWRENPGAIGIYVLILTIIFLVWARASLVTFALFESSAMPSVVSFIENLLALRNVEFAATFFGIGFVFAAFVFAISCIAIPHLIDRRADAVTAAALSILACGRNPALMTAWAAVIVALILLGLVTAFVGLIFTGPLIGHATWHAYRDLVPEPFMPVDELPAS